MFKLAHLSDLHLDYKSTKKNNAQGINLREADGYIAFAKVIDEIIKAEVDAVVISGDIFHTPTPEVRAIIFAQNQFRKLSGAKIPVYALAGNHDANDVKTDIAASRILNDPQRRLYSHIEPYVKYEISDGIFLHLVSHHMYSEQAETMSKIKPQNDAINIFATHGSCIDPLLQEKLHTEQSPREVVIPDFLLDDYDWSYCLLGHIHERGWVGSKDGVRDTANSKIYYNGSLIRRGFSDKECKLGRGWTEWTIADDGTFSSIHHKIPQRPQYDFAVIDCEKLSAKEISDLIISNLQGTQINKSNEFDSKTAPMLRQRLINIEPSKYSSLDLATINANSQHSFSWGLNIIKKEELKEIITDENIEPLVESGDMIKIYDEWVNNSATLKNIEKDIKDQVKTQSRKFIELGQEVSLEEE